jgi:Bacterial dnaA protein helix-turn-helix
MYLAKQVGGWSTTPIGRFYNGRHHTTVLHAIAKVEHLRETDESVEALIEVITAKLNPAVGWREVGSQTKEKAVLIEAIATRLLERVWKLGTTPHLVGRECGLFHLRKLVKGHHGE